LAAGRGAAADGTGAKLGHVAWSVAALTSCSSNRTATAHTTQT
jgi:hypothetical protein